MLLTQAIHTLDLLISLAGLPVEVTGFAATSPVHRMETEDLAWPRRFANGAIGTINATTCAYPGFPDAIDIIGTQGTARLDESGFGALHDGNALGDDGGCRRRRRCGSDGVFAPASPRRARRFPRRNRRDGQPKVTGREALKVHRLIDALLRSSQSGSRQSL